MAAGGRPAADGPRAIALAQANQSIPRPVARRACRPLSPPDPSPRASGHGAHPSDLHQEYVMDYVVALSDLPAHLRERVPDVRGQWLVTDGAPLAGCLLGRLASGELVYLVDYTGDDD